jgi:SAM-dependent methyltransferase
MDERGIQPPYYLEPYERAAKRHGDSLKSLLWESTRTQGARFGAFMKAVDFRGRSLLDVGCGRGDFLDYLLERKVRPAEYIGIEAVSPLVEVAAAKRGGPERRIIHADFVTEPRRMYTGSDAVVFSGSLNTLSVEGFYSTLEHAWAATAEWLVFNFLASADLAGANFLTWHRKEDVAAWAREKSAEVVQIGGYLAGDFTIALRKPDD